MQPKPPLTSGHLPSSVIGIIRPPDDRIMDVSSFTFDHLKKMIVQERQRYFPRDHVNLVFISTRKVIASNTRRNPQAVMATNMAFATVA